MRTMRTWRRIRSALALAALGCGGAPALAPDAALPDSAAPEVGSPDLARDLPGRPTNASCRPADRPVPAGSAGLPARLSLTGCFASDDPTRPLPALIPYAVRAPLWADGAEKDRWLALPDGARLEVGADGDLTPPAGTVLIKTFRLGARRVETRFFVRHPGGEWSGYTYAWNDAGTDAELLDEGSHRRSIEGREWIFPSRADCTACHTPAAGHALGLELAQLDQAQRSALAGQDLLVGPLPAIAPLPAPAGGESLASRARAYLHANCAGCHRPGVGNSGTTDLRAGTPLAATGTCDAEPKKGSLGLGPEYRIIVPGQPERSMVVVRMRELGSGRMPSVGSIAVDEAGVALVSDWIRSLPGCP